MAAALLIVEDDDADYSAILRAFQGLGAELLIERAETADEALDILAEKGPAPKEPPPALVLLDLNLPGSDGRTVLEEVKATERLRQLPIVIFSASANPKTIAECYRRGASGYVVKPMDFDRLEALVRALKDYWMETVTLPPQEETPSP